MRNGWIVITILVAILIFTYNPAVKTVTGEVQHVSTNELIINCPKKQPRFKPADDIGYSCTILINEQTVVESPIEIGQTVVIELVEKVKINSEKPLVAATIKVTP